MSTKPMSKDHKEALAQGRSEGRAVRAYLEALESSRPKRGRKRTKESVAARLESISDSLQEGNALQRLQLLQEQLDLTAELERFDMGVNVDDLEDGFVEVAASYARRKGISYAAFRQLGVPAVVLSKAGITRTAFG